MKIIQIRTYVSKALKQIRFKEERSTLNYNPPNAGSGVNPMDERLACLCAGLQPEAQRAGGGEGRVRQHNTAEWERRQKMAHSKKMKPQLWRCHCLNKLLFVRSYRLFNINEIFNEAPNCRLISPSLISTGES